MTTVKPLKPEEIAGLMALYYACSRSIHAHVSIPRFRQKLSDLYKDEAKKILEKIRRRGFVHVHKGREETYGINMAGVKKLKDLGRIP